MILHIGDRWTRTHGQVRWHSVRLKSALLLCVLSASAQGQSAPDQALDPAAVPGETLPNDPAAGTRPPDDKNSATISVDTPAPADKPVEETKHAQRLGEIVVTARRREESLQDVPISISVLSESALLEKGIKDGNDLAQASPGLSAYNAFDRSKTVYSIRGQGDVLGGVGATNPGVVPYYAEVPEFSPFLYDLSSVQVLKGPQGTLFGRNTTGGAVLFTPKKPNREFTGYVAQRFGTYSRNDHEFAIGGPLLSDVLLFRIAGQMLRRDGYTIDLEDDQDLDNEHRDSVRVSLVFQPLENLENYTLFQYDDLDENGTGTVIAAFVDAPTTPNREQLRAYIPIQEARGPRKVQHEFGDILKYRQRGVVNTTTWDFADKFTFKNIYRFSKGGYTDYLGDSDGGPYRNFEFSYPLIKPSFGRSDEVQIQFDNGSGLNAVAGFFYENNIVGYQTLAAPQGLPVGVLPGPGLPFGYRFVESHGIRGPSKSAFAQGSYAIFDDLTLTLGLRRTIDKRRALLSLSIDSDSPPIPPIVLADHQPYDLKTSANTWNVAVNYQWMPDLMAYGTVRRGYKAGGFVNAPILENPPGGAPPVTYKPEFVTSHEIGLKSEWELGSLQLRANGDVFCDKYTDIQRSASVPVPPNLIPANSITNAAKATILGADLDLQLVPSDWFDATVQYTYLKGTYDKYDDPDGFGDLSETRFPNTPAHQVTTTPAVHLTMPGRFGTITAQLPFYYQTSFAVSVNNKRNGVASNDNAVPGSNKPGFSRLDLRIDWRDMFFEGLSAAFYVRNLTNETYEVGGWDLMTAATVGVASSIYGAPRLTTFEMRYEF